MHLQFIFLGTFLFVLSVFGIMITGEIDEIKMKEESELLPSLNDILLMDLPVAKLKIKTKEVFQFQYNSPYSDGIGTFPINGVILEDTRKRLIIPIVVKYKKKAIRTTCVLDTGSPWTHFSQETFDAIGISHVEGYAQIAVHGLPIPVYISVNHFADINICGQSFLGDNSLKLIVDYRKRKVTIEKTPDLTEQEIEEL
jgi:hypothetical protein